MTDHRPEIVRAERELIWKHLDHLRGHPAAAYPGRYVRERGPDHTVVLAEREVYTDPATGKKKARLKGRFAYRLPDAGLTWHDPRKLPRSYVGRVLVAASNDAVAAAHPRPGPTLTMGGTVRAEGHPRPMYPHELGEYAPLEAVLRLLDERERAADLRRANAGGAA